MERIALERWRQ